MRGRVGRRRLRWPLDLALITVLLQTICFQVTSASHTPSQPSSDGGSSSSSSNTGQGPPLTLDTPDNDPGTGANDCSDYSILYNVVPQGKGKTPHSILGNVDTVEECIRLCCDAGPQCRYAWMFNSVCYSVKCSVTDQNLCQPVKVSFVSTYVWVHKDSTDVSNPDDHPQPTDQSGVTTSTDDDNVNTDIDEQDEQTSITGDDSQPYHPRITSSVSIAQSSSLTTSTPTISSSAPNGIAPSKSVMVSTSPVATPPSNVINDKKLLYKTVTVAFDNGGNKVLTLPDNSVKVFGSTWPKSNHYMYQWTKVAGPASGDLVGIHEKTLQLKNLVEGIYTLQLTVYDTHGNYGIGTVNITINPEPHENQPPVVIISPKSGTSYTPPVTTVVLDASSTTDDGGFDKLTFKWNLMAAPLQALKEDEANWNKPLLKLTNPVVGTYQFKLTVTDSEGLSTVDQTNFTVLQEKDYPPVANAGSTVLIRLPNNAVTLSAKGSKDDKGIVKYQWNKIEGKAVDITGTDSPRLHLTHLEAGLYQFELVVTDTIGQTSSDTVTVDVQEEDNQPPIARINGDLVVRYPKTKAVLNGSQSYDDYQITSYHWTQIAGPEDIVLDEVSEPILRVRGLHVSGHSPTMYGFTLDVVDYRNLTNSTTVYVKYYKDENLLPFVDAGKNVTITLPERTAILNGSLSHDGFGIASYQWTRSHDSPAAGRVVGGSDHTPVLMITDLVNGTYHFTLNVTNTNRKSKTDKVTLLVRKDPKESYMVQIYLDEIIYKFNESDKESLEDQLVLKMGRLHQRVHIQDILPHSEHIQVEFYVTDKHGGLVNSSEVYSALIKDGQSFTLGKYHTIAVEEKVCHNPCSDRGLCDPRTKRCVCSTFWMENPFKANFGKKESNCEWSLLYVIMIAMAIVGVFILGVWLCCCCCMRRRKASKRRKVKYAILDHKENEGDLQMFPRGVQGKNQSLIVTESETEEEILFESSGKKGKSKSEKQSLIPRNNKSSPSAIKVLRNDLKSATEMRNAKNKEQ